MSLLGAMKSVPEEEMGGDVSPHRALAPMSEKVSVTIKSVCGLNFIVIENLQLATGPSSVHG